MHLDHVARRAGERRDDRRFAARDPVEQRGLAGIGRPRDRDHQTFAQPFAARGVGRALRRFLFAATSQRLERLRGDIARDIGLVGEIDAGFGERLRFDQTPAPRLGAIAEQALQLPQSLAALRIGVGINQIRETFDGGEVELAVLERAARELAGQCHAQSVHRCERGEQRGDHRASAMQLDLGGVFARFAFRAGKNNASASSMISLDLRIADAREHRAARLRNFSDQRFQRVAGARTGDAHDGDRDRRAARGERVDGVSIGHGEKLGTTTTRNNIPLACFPIPAIKADFAPQVAAQESAAARTGRRGRYSR